MMIFAILIRVYILVLAKALIMFCIIACLIYNYENRIPFFNKEIIIASCNGWCMFYGEVFSRRNWMNEAYIAYLAKQGKRKIKWFK